MAARSGRKAAACSTPSFRERAASPTGREESIWSTWPPCLVISTYSSPPSARAEKPQAGRFPAPSEVRVNTSARSPAKAAAARRASSSVTWGRPSSIWGVRPDRCSEKGPS